MEHFFLNMENASDLIGKKVTWTAEGYNKRYSGKCLVKSVDFSKRNPLETEVIFGDNLDYAYLEGFGLKEENGKYAIDTNAPKVFTYSDDFREVEVCAVE